MRSKILAFAAIIIFCLMIVYAISYGLGHVNIVDNSNPDEEGIVAENIIDSPLNLNNLEQIDDFNLDKKQLLTSAEPDSIFQGNPLEKRISELKNTYVLDSFGYIVGSVDDIDYKPEDASILTLSLRKSLKEEDAPSVFELPADTISVVEYYQKIYVQLSEEQTEALAELIY